MTDRPINVIENINFNANKGLGLSLDIRRSRKAIKGLLQNI